MTTGFEITELNRRLANMIRLGTVKEANYKENIPHVKVAIGDLETA